VFETPEHTEVFPLITPGVGGAEFTVIAKVCGAEEPQLLFAVTKIFPLEEPAVAFIEFVVDVPVQPFGSVHV
jgi:hypothetical protein